MQTLSHILFFHQNFRRKPEKAAKWNLHSWFLGTLSKIAHNLVISDIGNFSYWTLKIYL